MPDDAPVRFKRPPIFELASFSGWADVSKTMAPFYVSNNLIAPDGPLAAEVAAIAQADASELGRAQRALELVQDKIRYFAVGMNDGNYIPQKPEDMRSSTAQKKVRWILGLPSCSIRESR